MPAESKIHALESIRRTPVNTNDISPPSNYLAKKVQTNSMTGAAVFPYEITFQCFSAECANVLAHAEDVPVALHLLEERLTNRFEIRDVGHQGFAPSAFQVPQLSGRSWP